MKKKILFTLALAILLAMPLGFAFAGDAHVSKTETLYLDKAKAYNGYHIFTSIAATTPELGATYLIDLEGNVVHKWLMPEDHTISLHAYLLPNGNLAPGHHAPPCRRRQDPRAGRGRDRVRRHQVPGSGLERQCPLGGPSPQPPGHHRGGVPADHRTDRCPDE